MSDEHETADEVDEVDDGYEVELVEVEVAVVPVDVVEVDARTAYAARDAALHTRAEHDHPDVAGETGSQQDDTLDAALDQVDDGAAQVREEHVESGPGELPLLIPGRDRFARLDAVPVTGEARVDAATARLDELSDLPTADHVAVYDDVHHRLQDSLADTDPT